ncbi:MAG TPA: signal peptidase I [Patescibacteria group bacterium]|nr:signal peptidase I [Patescibacteria group bacterium]
MHQPTARSAPGDLHPAETTTGSTARPARRRWAPLVRLLDWVVTGALVGGILLAGFIAYGLLDNRWYKVVAVAGGSMSPTIEPGDLIVLTRPPEEVRTGMILTLEVDGQVVTHRVVGFRPDGSFVTKGDANTVRDDFRGLYVRVVGEYRFRIPWLGTLLGIGTMWGTTTSAYFSDRVSIDVSAGTADEFAVDEPLSVELLDEAAGPTQVASGDEPATTPDPTPEPTPAPTPEPAATPLPDP